MGKLINNIVPKKAPIPPPKANKKVKKNWKDCFFKLINLTYIC